MLFELAQPDDTPISVTQTLFFLHSRKPDQTDGKQMLLIRSSRIDMAYCFYSVMFNK